MSFFHFSPIPSFTTPTGPYSVGTHEVEIPASELSSPAPGPSISTVSYRIFYPCSPATKGKVKYAYWLPDPQHEYFTAYARFLRASSWLASLLSYFPLFRPIFHTTIPAVPSTPLLPSSHRWPVAIFSHGLGGSKNAYSALCSSLASHGLVVVALDHRDGSAPISFIRTRAGSYKDAKKVDFRQLGHEGGIEVDGKRDQQLRIRCWELGAAWETITMIDRGKTFTNLAEAGKGVTAPAAGTAPSPPPLEDFKNRLDVHTPGRVAWIGHSFGAATVAQFVKSVAYYPSGSSSSSPDSATTLLANPPSPALRRQITPASPTVFLDLWAQPLKSVYTRALWEKRLPCYSNNCHGNNTNTNAAAAAAAAATQVGTGEAVTPAASAASAPLAILSESFFNWKANLADTLRVLSPPPLPSPSQPHPSSFTSSSSHAAAHRERATQLSHGTGSEPREGDSQKKLQLQPQPHLFYPLHSAHLSQSDFGPLFPWVTRRVFKAEDPQRTIVLNVRAILEALRRAGLVGLARTSARDMEVAALEKEEVVGAAAGGHEQDGGFSDESILDTKEGRVRGWVAIPVSLEKGVGMGEDGVLDQGIGGRRDEAEAEGVVREVKEGVVGEDEGYDSPGNMATPPEAAVEGEVKAGVS